MPYNLYYLNLYLFTLRVNSIGISKFDESIPIEPNFMSKKINQSSYAPILMAALIQ